jgi:hypothetical protein
MISNLPERTGRSLDEWLMLTPAAPEQKHSTIVAWLQHEHGMTHGYANLVATAHLRPDSLSATEAVDYVHRLDAQYAGKEHLKPIYDRLIEVASGFDGGFDAILKRNYVSLRRRKQFAIIKPSTKTRLDLGLCMRGVEPAGRLEPSGKFSSMASHRVRITSVDEVDNEISIWLRLAHHLS